MSTQAITLALELAIQLLVRSQRISSLVAAAQTDGRDLTTEEWAAITQDADDSRAALVTSIEKAKAAGR